MMRFTTVAALLILLVAAPVGADRGSGGHGGRGGGWHGHDGGHFHGGFHGPRASIFIGGFWDPFWPRYYAYPYYYPYPVPYPYPVYPPPPPDDRGYARDEDSEPPPRAETSPDDGERATYGLIQLRGVPDGADVDLDGRFWLRAQALDNRWLAVPQGQHTIAARVEGDESQPRDIEIRAGAKQVLKFGPFRKR
jgi:hypothetical protein